MMSDIDDAVILAARLFLATLFLIFGWRKLRDCPGTVSQMVQDGVPTPVLAAARRDLHGASGCVRGRCRRVHTSLGRAHGFIYAGNFAYRASLLDDDRRGSARQHGELLQKPQHHGRLPAVVRYRRGKIFDRCIVRHRRAMTGWPPYDPRDTFSKRLISRSRLRRDSRWIQNRPFSWSISCWWQTARRPSDSSVCKLPPTS